MSRSKSEEGPAARSFPPWAGLYSRGRKSGQVWVRTPGREKAANHNGFPQPMSGGLKLYDPIDDVGHRLSSSQACSECDLERLCLHRAHAEHGEAENVALLVDLLHHLVALGLAKVAGLLVEDHFQVIPFRVVPDLQSLPVVVHSGTPFLLRSVR